MTDLTAAARSIDGIGPGDRAFTPVCAEPFRGYPFRYAWPRRHDMFGCTRIRHLAEAILNLWERTGCPDRRNPPADPTHARQFLTAVAYGTALRENRINPAD